MNLAALIQTMPGITGATTDQSVLDWLTTPSVDHQGAISKAQILQWGGDNNRRKNIRVAAADLNSVGCNVSMTAEDMLKASDVPTFDTGSATNVALLNGLVLAGVLVQSDVDALMELGYSLITPLQANNLPSNPPINAITRARAV